MKLHTCMVNKFDFNKLLFGYKTQSSIVEISMLILDPDLINSCRVCRSPNQDGDYQCLFDTASQHEAGDTELTESGTLYEKLLDIPLNERNYYPKFLCNSCHLQMKLLMKLKDKAIKTLEYLQSIYDDIDAHTTEYLENETSNYNYQNNKQIVSPNEPQNCQNLLDEYNKVGQDNVANEYDEELDKTTADETVYENGIVENKSNILDLKNTYTAADIETSLEEDLRVQTDDALENTFLTEINPNASIIQIANSEKQFPNMKVDHLLDKNDFITEIYELIDDECDIEEMYLENQEIIENVDYNPVSEINTETASSTYNEIEYLLEEEIDYLEGETNLAEIKNPAKRRKLHKSSNTNRMYKCFSCELEFTNFQLYKSHRIEDHNDCFNCNECSREFKTMAALQKHMKSQHNDEPAFQCEICQKTFNQKVHFQYHMNYHNNIRNYKCDVCEKAFIAKADLKTHQRLHTGERPYVCSICGKDYLMMEHLKAHFITHTELSFPCEICNKQFSTHKTLRLHVRTIHEDEPRFKCTFCSKPFRRKHHLEYHLKSHGKNLAIIINESDNLEDTVGEAVDDSGFIF